MSWESVLKAEKVFILSEEMSMGYNEVIAVFKSKEALNKYLLETHSGHIKEGFENEQGEIQFRSDKEARTLALQDIMRTYDYIINEAEMKE